MAVPVSQAINAYANAGKAMATSQEATGGESFGKLLQNTASGLVDDLKKGEQMSMQAVTGKADLNEVTAAVNNAQVALQAVIAVRDRVISAYQDVIKMQM